MQFDARQQAVDGTGLDRRRAGCSRRNWRRRCGFSRRSNGWTRRATRRSTVVCEGRSSATRASFGAEPEVTPYDQWAIAARVRCELPHGQVAQQWFTAGDILGMLPMEGEGGNLMAVVWSVSQERKKALLQATDARFCTSNWRWRARTALAGSA